jgi:hypothetical protein
MMHNPIIKTDMKAYEVRQLNNDTVLTALNQNYPGSSLCCCARVPALFPSVKEPTEVILPAK